MVVRRLIDANNACERCRLKDAGNCGCCIIGAAPTVDAVEVVRCKDCRAWDRGRISCEGLARCNSGEGGIRYRSGSDYCSKGVRVSDG